MVIPGMVTEWVKVGEFRGPQGEQGLAGTITVGTVDGTAPGTEPTVVNVGTITDAIFQLYDP